MSENAEDKKSFEDISEEKNQGLLAEFFDLLKHNKKWWMAPIIILLLMFGALIVVAGSKAAPFIYTLF